jgi:hypothetical protein
MSRWFLRSLLVGLVSIISLLSSAFIRLGLDLCHIHASTTTAPYLTMRAPPFVSSDVIFFFCSGRGDDAGDALLGFSFSTLCVPLNCTPSYLLLLHLYLLPLLAV